MSLVHLGARCTSVETGEQIARARFADGSEVEADVIVGADGLHSAVRTSLFGEQPPRFTHCVCWRWMVPVDAIPARLRSRNSAMWMGPHGHVVHYWVRGGELLNLVAHYDSDAWTEESWTRETDRDELLQTYAGWHPDLLSLYACGER